MVLEQQPRKLAQHRFGFLAFLVQHAEAADQFGQGIGGAGFRQTGQCFETEFFVESLALEQRDINELAARRFAQFLVRQPAEHVGSGRRAFGQEQCFLGRLIGGAEGQRRQSDGNDQREQQAWRAERGHTHNNISKQISQCRKVGRPQLKNLSATCGQESAARLRSKSPHTRPLPKTNSLALECSAHS